MLIYFKCLNLKIKMSSILIKMFSRQQTLVFLFLLIAIFIFPKIDSKPLESQPTCSKNTSCRAENFLRNFKNGPSSNELCKLCDIAVEVIRNLIVKNDTAQFVKLATLFCDIFKIEDPTVCDYVIKTYQVNLFI